MHEYWVIDVDNSKVRLFRNPADGTYGETMTASSTESIAPQAASQAVLDLKWLFA